MKKWEDENAGTFLVLRRKTGRMRCEAHSGYDNRAEGCRVYLAHTCSLHRAGGDCADAGSVRG